MKTMAPNVKNRGITRTQSHDPQIKYTKKIIIQLGSGIPKMISACKEAGLPEPELKEMGGYFRVNMFRPGEKTTLATTQATTQVSLTERAIFIETDPK